MALMINLNTLEMEPHPKFKGVKIGFVVTKEKCSELSITVLEIEKGMEIPIHIHEKEADTIFVLEGKGKVFLNGEWKELKPGDVVVIPPQEKHGVVAETFLKCYIVHAPALW
jgi:quercetin dioxygenase-like cupin family protein